jgi:hypothetical protein
MHEAGYAAGIVGPEGGSIHGLEKESAGVVHFARAPAGLQ